MLNFNITHFQIYSETPHLSYRILHSIKIWKAKSQFPQFNCVTIHFTDFESSGSNTQGSGIATWTENLLRVLWGWRTCLGRIVEKYLSAWSAVAWQCRWAGWCPRSLDSSTPPPCLCSFLAGTWLAEGKITEMHAVSTWGLNDILAFWRNIWGQIV